MGATTDTQLIDTDGASQPRRSFRFSIRILLMAIFIIGVGFALWQQQQRLQRAQSVLEAHGLLWEMEPLPDDMFRVRVKEVVSKNDFVVREVTLEANEKPDIELLLGEKPDRLFFQGIPPQPQSGGPWRITFAIAASVTSLQGSDGKYMTIINVDVPIVNGGYGIKHRISNRNLPTDIGQFVDIQFASGDYPLGKPVELLVLDAPDTEKEKIQLLVKLPKSGKATGKTGQP